MTEEEKEQKFCCMCLSKDYKLFLSILLGSFIGVFYALCLFASLHKSLSYCPECTRPHVPVYSTFDAPPVHQHK